MMASSNHSLGLFDESFLSNASLSSGSSGSTTSTYSSSLFQPDRGNNGQHDSYTYRSNEFDSDDNKYRKPRSALHSFALNSWYLIRGIWRETGRPVWRRLFRFIKQFKWHIVGVTCLFFLIIAYAQSRMPLFIRYRDTPFDRQIAQEIIHASEEYLATNPKEACVSSLELSLHEPRPYYHLVIRKRGARDSVHDLHLLNPHIIAFGDAATIRTMTTTSLDEDDKTKIEITQANNNNIDLTSDKMFHLPPSLNEDRASVAAKKDSSKSASTDITSSGGVTATGHGHTHLHVIEDGPLPDGMRYKRELSTECEYVYHRGGGLWGALRRLVTSSHPPIPERLRPRYDSVLVTFWHPLNFATETRRFSGAAAICIQHYVDVHRGDYVC